LFPVLNGWHDDKTGAGPVILVISTKTWVSTLGGGSL